MKSSFLSLCTAASFIILFSNCGKDDDPKPAATDFSPVTTGSNWTYKYTEGTTIDTVKLTATANSKDINGKSYKILLTGTGDTAYTAKADHDYYRFQSFPSVGINNFEELYLKDDKVLNDTWSSTTSIVIPVFGSIPVTLLYTVKGVGESHSTLGKTYSEVTHIRLDITASGLTAGGGDFYYQKGVGMVDSHIAVTSPLGGQQYSSTQELISYEIK